MRAKKNVILIVIAYQIIPLALIGAWIMPAFFDLFGVSWSDQTWRMYAATTGAWIILEAPLIIFFRVRVAGWKKRGEPNKISSANGAARHR